MYWVRCAAANCCSWLIDLLLQFHNDWRARVESLLARLDSLFVEHPERGAVARAMLLGDRSFVDSSVVLAFQKTAAYHVLVVAGLHVGALVMFLWWVGKRLRFSMLAISLMTLLALAAYVGIVQDRPPILRAALMAALYLCARPLFRRVELLNTIAVAALILLIWKPSSLGDSSFELSFLGCCRDCGVGAALDGEVERAISRGAESFG